MGNKKPYTCSLRRLGLFLYKGIINISDSKTVNSAETWTLSHWFVAQRISTLKGPH